MASSADGSKLVAAIWGGSTPSVFSTYIYTSTNSGATWQTNDAPNVTWTAVASSADGNKLVAVVEYVGGGVYTLQTKPSPQLSLAPKNTNVALSWLIPSTNFVLQQSSDLTSWADVTNAPALNLTNLQNQVTVSVSNACSFYRLKTP